MLWCRTIYVVLLFTSFTTLASQQLTVVLDWFPNPDHAPLVIAQEKGFFREQHLSVKLIAPADPADPPKWVAAGAADVAITYEPLFMQQVDQGLPLISIGTLIDQPLNCLVTLKERHITTLADLKNKRIGSGSSHISDTMLRIMLHQYGLSENDIELINVHYNLTQALLTKKVDAVIDMNRNIEIPQLLADGYAIRFFLPEQHGIPDYSELVFITHIKYRHDPSLSRFMAALQKAIQYLRKHPEAAWQSFITRYPEANHPVNHRIWIATMPYFSSHPSCVNQRKWQRFAIFMQKNGLIKTVQPLSRYIVTLKKES